MPPKKQKTGDSNPSKSTMEFTLCYIKPDITSQEEREKIMDDIQKSGFTILYSVPFHFTKENAEDFYREHKGKGFFENLVQFTASNECLVLILAKENAIQEFRKLIGPTNPIKAKEEAPETLRAKYGTEGPRNAVHGSDSQESYQREVELFDIWIPFKDQRTPFGLSLENFMCAENLHFSFCEV